MTKSVVETEVAANPVKEAMNFDDFTKMDLRTATILEAEKVLAIRNIPITFLHLLRNSHANIGFFLNLHRHPYSDNS